MQERHVLMLHGGGLRSLVALASLHSRQPAPRITLLHVRDGRANARQRLACAQRQAEHYGVQRLIESPTLTLGTDPAAVPTPPPLLRPRLALAALAAALEVRADAVVWPLQCDAEFHLVGRLTEQALLLQHAAEIERAVVPALQTPLLELSDRQLVELGVRLDVPWHLAWACEGTGERSCEQCEVCRRRRAAFQAAGVIDALRGAVVARA